jgi:hypothetical protein
MRSVRTRVSENWRTVVLVVALALTAGLLSWRAATSIRDTTASPPPTSAAPTTVPPARVDLLSRADLPPGWHAQPTGTPGTAPAGRAADLLYRTCSSTPDPAIDASPDVRSDTFTRPSTAAGLPPARAWATATEWSTTDAAERSYTPVASGAWHWCLGQLGPRVLDGAGEQPAGARCTAGPLPGIHTTPTEGASRIRCTAPGDPSGPSYHHDVLVARAGRWEINVNLTWWADGDAGEPADQLAARLLATAGDRASAGAP